MTLKLPSLGPAVVTLGVFDGVHRGHRHLVEATSHAAVERKASSVALVFDPPPIEVIQPDASVLRLLPVDLVLERLRDAGIDHALTIAFDPALREMPPEAFLDALAPGIELRAMTMTPDSSFGHRRAGSLERVTEIGEERGFEAIAVDPLVADGAPVSSSRIRAALGTGDIAAATELLAARPLLRGTVVHGDGRGRDLGFPTANLEFDYTPALPALGIYVGWVTVEGRHVDPGSPALVSVGVRPTFHDGARVLVEAYLLDWEGDLYDSQATLELGDRLRDERRFASVEALVEQMHADEADARRRLGLDPRRS